MQGKGVEVRVTKNTLLRLAAAAAEKPEIGELGEGPTALVFGYGDAVEMAKAVTEYAQSAKNAFAPRRAFVEGRLLTARELAELATLPPRPILAGQVAGRAAVAGVRGWRSSWPARSSSRRRSS